MEIDLQTHQGWLPRWLQLLGTPQPHRAALFHHLWCVFYICLSPPPVVQSVVCAVNTWMQIYLIICAASRLLCFCCYSATVRILGHVSRSWSTHKGLCWVSHPWHDRHVGMDHSLWSDRGGSRGCSVRCRMLSSIPGVYPPDTESSFQLQQPKMSLDVVKYPPEDTAVLPPLGTTALD